MTSPTEHPSPNPVDYAERVLDVHGPWREAQDRLARHSEASQGVDDAKRSIRAIKQDIEDRKLELVTNAPSMPGYPSSGVQAQRDFKKLLVEGDAEIKRHEASLASCQSTLEDLQSQVRHAELGLSVLTARLTELGGLLHYYAEAKSAQTARQHTYTSAQDTGDTR